MVPSTSPPTSSSSSSLLVPAALCFAAGAATATALCYIWWQPPQDKKKPRPEDEETWTTTLTNVVEDLSMRIGELPSRTQKEASQIPWPWHRMNKHKQKKNTTSNNHSQNGDAESSASPDSASSSPLRASSSFGGGGEPPLSPSADLCIGSIFGLDVGGSLAKLVYFEERQSSRRRSRRNHGNNSSSSTSHQSTLYNHHHHERRSMANLASFSSQLSAAHHEETPDNDDTGNSASAAVRRGMSRKSVSAQDVIVNGNHHINHLTNNNGGGRSSEGNLQAPPSDDDEAGSAPAAPPPPLDLRRTQSETTVPAVRRTQSMLDFLTQKEHRAQALDRFYAFARDNLSNLSGGGNGTEEPSSSSQPPSTRAQSAPEPSTPSQAPPLSTTTTTTTNDMVRDEDLSFDCLDGTFHFLHFETRHMQHAVNLIRRYELHQTIHSLGATGGGAHKFASVFSTELGIDMRKLDELSCLVAGLQFVLDTVVGECYTYRPPHTEEEDNNNKPKTTKTKKSSSVLNNHYGNYVGVEPENWSSVMGQDDDEEEEGEHNILEDEDDDDQDGTKKPATEAAEEPQQSSSASVGRAAPRPGNKVDEWWWSRKVPRGDALATTAGNDSSSNTTTTSAYPYLLVTIGTGVSILRVDGPGQHERISGSTIGGGTYWGLIRLLTSVDNFSDVIRLAERGDPSKVDMMVGDIYGFTNSQALEKLGLHPDLVASSFGKLVAKDGDPAEGLQEQDLARALLLMVTNNIGQVAYLNARLHCTNRIYFVGNFLRQNKLSQRRLSFAIDYWSKGNMEALFLEHEGYFGALGAFLLSQPNSSSSSSMISSPSLRFSQQQQQKQVSQRKKRVG